MNPKTKKIKMKRDYSTIDGRIFLAHCYYTVRQDFADKLCAEGLCYVLNEWQEDGITYKQYQ